MPRLVASIVCAVFLLIATGCGSSSGRTKPLRAYPDRVAEAIHVAEFNEQVGPATHTVTIPAKASAIIVRFDCVGKGEKFTLNVSKLGRGGWDCDTIASSAWTTGIQNVRDEPVVQAGEVMTFKVTVAADVRWSMSVDLPQDKRAYDSLRGIAP